MANKYRVKLGYYGYTFEDRNAAIDFAEMAFDSADDADRSVSVELIKDEEQEEQEGEEDE